MDENGTGTVEKDINDVFDNIAFSEEQITNKAFEEGLIKGKEDGKVDGYHLGFHRGLEFGNEIGFYKGLINILSGNADNPKIKNNQKIEGLITKLKDLLNNFPKDNNEDEDILKLMDDIRANYRKLNSLLKLNITYPVLSSMSF